MASFSFDTATVAPRENNFDLLPAGNYAAQILESDIAPLKSGNGTALKLTFEVLTDGYRGRKIWVNLNVQHTNSQAEQISQQQLRELCDAVGLARMTDTAELHNKPVDVKVKIRVSKDPQYQDQNEIIGYKALGGAVSPGFRSAPMHAAPSQASTVPAGIPAMIPPQAAATGGTPPWAKKSA